MNPMSHFRPSPSNKIGVISCYTLVVFLCVILFALFWDAEFFKSINGGGNASAAFLSFSTTSSKVRAFRSSSTLRSTNNTTTANHTNKTKVVIHNHSVTGTMTVLAANASSLLPRRPQQTNNTHHDHHGHVTITDDDNDQENSLSSLDYCGCGRDVCTSKSLSKRNEFFSCQGRISFLMTRHKLSLQSACSTASKEGSNPPCGPECDPERCLQQLPSTIGTPTSSVAAAAAAAAAAQQEKKQQPPLVVSSHVNDNTTSSRNDTDRMGEQDFQALMVAQNSSLSCLTRRGKHGRWVRDLDYASKSFYLLPGEKPQPSAGTSSTTSTNQSTGGGMLYPEHAMYKWQDSSSTDCQMELVSMEGLCRVFQKLNITNLFFLGDSLAHMMGGKSLWGLLGRTDIFAETSHAGIVQHEIQCPIIKTDDDAVVSSWNFTFTFVRNDVLKELPDYSSYDPPLVPRIKVYPNFRRRGPKCDSVGFQRSDYCWPWIDRYANMTTTTEGGGGSGRTLFIASDGAHMGSEFVKLQGAFDSFVNQTQRIRRPNDIIVFRTVPPGHTHCEKYSKPFADQAQFDQAQTKGVFNWDTLVRFNDYVKERVGEMNIQRRDNEFPWLVLDVEPMSILRPDGHLNPPKDCLHYNTPGPPDFWNHLLYSQLLGIVNGEKLS